VRHKGLLVIAALVAVPTAGVLITWAAWEHGALDAPALPGTVEVSALYTNGRLIGCTLRSTLPRNDLVGYTAHADGDTLVLNVTRRRLLAGKRPPNALQIELELPPPCVRLALRSPTATSADGQLVIWPR